MSGITPEGKLLDLIKQAHGKLKLKKELKIFTKVNILLIGLIVVILAIFLADVFTSDYRMPELSVDLPKQSVLPKLHEFNEDAEDMDVVIGERVSIPKGDVAKDLNLLGVITGDNDQAIIEDKSENKTFFLYQGDSFREFKVRDIKDSSVILDYKGEEIELNM